LLFYSKFSKNLGFSLKNGGFSMKNTNKMEIVASALLKLTDEELFL